MWRSLVEQEIVAPKARAAQRAVRGMVSVDKSERSEVRRYCVVALTIDCECMTDDNQTTV